jgi:myo-inositol-1(or 4)-monophosphatase
MLLHPDFTSSVSFESDFIRNVTDIMRRVSDAVIEVHDRADYHIESKGEAGPLTEADLLADRMLKEGLMALCSPCAWISEESPQDTHRLNHASAWIVDPIDGTKEFIAKNGEYSVSVGLAINGNAVLGAVALPHSNRIIIGGSMLGAVYNITGNDSVCYTTHAKRTDLKGSHIMVSRSEWKRGFFESMERDFIINPQGSIARKLALLAAGEADIVVSLNPKNEWDIAGGIALILALDGYSAYILKTREPYRFNQPDLITYGLVAGPEKLCRDFMDFHTENNLPIYNSYA